MPGSAARGAGHARVAPLLIAGLWAAPAAADDPPELSTVEVRAGREQLAGIAASAGEGVITGQRLAAVPLLRPGEALELVPGLIATQHAGDGKANQYFLRGFNLDHGSDFAIAVAGVPVNLPSHAHGQGYSDLNFLIPELVDRIAYRKGPYFADQGDFAAAGAAEIEYFRRLDSALAQVTGGGNGYARSLLAGSPVFGDGHLLYGLEVFHNDGPWQVAENYRKVNGVLRYAEGSRDDGFALSALAYRGRWTSTDQVAERAIDSGQVDRYGSLDPSSGGATYRYSLAGEWARRQGDAQMRASAWALRSGLELWSNFQYCLNDLAATGNCAAGDQFKQAERRSAGGFAVSHAIVDQWGGVAVDNAFGIQGRVDRIAPLGLYRSSERRTLATVREDRVGQQSLGLWAQNETRWTERFRSVLGLRADAYAFDVASNLAANSGQAGDRIVTPKLALIFGPWRGSEIYVDYGHGFHSNDARGATASVDPKDGVSRIASVRPLVRSRGRELGLRSEILPGWQSTAALWQLDSASELLFVGDAGTTEPSRPSRRSGIEWSNRYVADWLALDADLAWSQARFRDGDPAGARIPGAATTTANLGLSVDPRGPWFAALRLRWFGARPLVADNSVRSQPSALFNLRLGYRADRQTQLALEVYNLFDRRSNDIEYWYASQLAGEAAPQFDRHLHPGEPRSLRLTLQYRY